MYSPVFLYNIQLHKLTHFGHSPQRTQRISVLWDISYIDWISGSFFFILYMYIYRCEVPKRRHSRSKGNEAEYELQTEGRA